MRHFFGECWGHPHFYSTRLQRDVHIDTDTVAPTFVICDEPVCPNRYCWTPSHDSILERSWWSLALDWLGLITIPGW